MNLRPVVAGHPFALTCERDGCVRQEIYQGQEAWFFDTRPGDRAPGDTGPVERNRLDGWPRLFAHGIPWRLRFMFQPLLGWSAVRPTASWCLIFESHAKEKPGIAGAGPFTIEHNRHSDGTMRFEACVKQPIFDASGRMFDQKRTYYPLGDLIQGNKYEFQVEGMTGPKGHLHLVLNGLPIIRHEGPFGYSDCPLYPQLGTYRNADKTLRQPSRYVIRECSSC